MYQREMVLYTRSRSLRCWRAKRLLTRRGYQFKAVETTTDELLGLVKQLSPKSTYLQSSVPYLFIDHRPVGGFREIRALDGSGVLQRLVRGAL
jgi:glutaredoxin